jgi:hypothetical protein
MKTKADERTYTVEELKVADLLVDTRVQRDGLQQMKVDNIVDGTARRLSSESLKVPEPSLPMCMRV